LQLEQAIFKAFAAIGFGIVETDIFRCSRVEIAVEFSTGHLMRPCAASMGRSIALGTIRTCPHKS
jgi:hypothetical protein